MKGPAGLMRKAFKLLDVLELTKTEKEKINYRMGPKGPQWDNTDYEAKISLPADTKPILQRLVRDEIKTLETQEKWTPVLVNNIEGLCETLDVDFDAVLAEIDTTTKEE
jgi:hypothetical protein